MTHSQLVASLLAHSHLIAKGRQKLIVVLHLLFALKVGEIVQQVEARIPRPGGVEREHRQHRLEGLDFGQTGRLVSGAVLARTGTLAHEVVQRLLRPLQLVVRRV